MILTTINPISIIQNAYASCVSKCHKQLITEKNYVSVQDSLLPAMSAHFGLPPLHITFFQATFFDDIILKGYKNKPNDITAHSTVAMIYGQKCYLNVFSNKQNEMHMISFDAQTLYHTQFAKIVYMGENMEEKESLIDHWQKNFLTNWKELDISKRLRHSNLIILSELNVPNILLKANINRQNIVHWINGSEIIIRAGEPRLRISSSSEYWDKQRNMTLLQLAITSSLISWLQMLYQFQKSIYHTLAKYDQWLDLCMCKALSEALDLRDDLKDEIERYNYWKNRSLSLDSFIASKSNRKFAFVALLNSWQKLLEPHVK
ncbi:unnamed protein product, partial [Onchocerca ochengi]|uniref:AraC family transcriptional regulator n=1 Tax=Onchocerca ochengi TaxID=42157 RepID=A0A182ER06_ONCOC